MKSNNVLYIPIGKKTFNLEEAEKQRVVSSKLLRKVSKSLFEPESILTSPEEVSEFIGNIKNTDIDLIIYQSLTFADAEAIDLLVKELKVPVLVWSIREPFVGGRLHLNSLTGGNSSCHHLNYLNHPYYFVFGNAEEISVSYKITQLIDGEQREREFGSRSQDVQTNVGQGEKEQVGKVISELKNMKVGVIGEHPPGFFFSDTNDSDLKKQLGVEVKYYDLENAFEECVKLPKEEWVHAIDRAEQQVIGINRDDEKVQRFAQFTTHIEKEIEKEQLTSIAVRCYPEFFNQLGAAACSTLSQFTEDGIVSACESDIHGSISMYVLQQLSEGSAPYLGDMVHVNEESNSVVFWHCGAGAYSLAHPETGAQAGVHPNRKLGFTMEFGLKPGQVTIFRVGYTSEGYRLLVMKGNALDTPQRFNGTSVEVELETDVTETVTELIEEGVEPHYALVYADVSDKLIELGHQLGLETIVYQMD